MSAHPKRVTVRAPGYPPIKRAGDTGRILVSAPDSRYITDAESAYVRGLIRAQLRLAVGVLVGFVVTAGTLGAVLLLLPGLAAYEVFGVPLPWLLHAYGFYPIIFVFAGIFVRSARRNERRFAQIRASE